MLQFFPTVEGYVDAANESSSGKLQENDYYPFGVENQKSSSQKNFLFTKNNYKYNGKEFQDEFNINLYDYGARNYDPAIGRWFNIDPLAEKAPNWTPYRYGFNNPLRFIDPTGMLEDDYQLHKDGSDTLLQKTDDKSDTLYASNNDGSVDKNTSVTVGKEGADSNVIGDLAYRKGAYLGNFSGRSGGFRPHIASSGTNNSEDAFNIYSFAAKNSNVEWGMTGFKSNGIEHFLLYTMHNESLTPAVKRMLGENFLELIFDIHSHKNRNSPSEDGYNAGDYDAVAATNRQYAQKHGKKSLDSHRYPSNYLLYAPNNGTMVLHKYWGIPQGNKVGSGSRELGVVVQGNLGKYFK